MKYYNVTFKWNGNTYCSNIAVGTRETVEKHYKSKYEWVKIEPASEYAIETAKRKGMPIVEV